MTKPGTATFPTLFLFVASMLLAGCAAQTAAPHGGGNAMGNVASLPPSETEPGQGAAVPTPDKLVGLSAAELRAAFGPPTLLRADGPAQLWQYAGAGCVLHVFLDQESGVWRVKHAETRIDDPAASNPPTCVPWKGNSPSS